MKQPAVLVVTGAYHPELSGGGLQARELIRVLRDRVDFTVLTTSMSVSETVRVDGVLVHRVAVDLKRVWSRVHGVLRFTWLVLRLGRQADLVHLQGYSRKNILATMAARLLRKRLLLSLRTGVHDDARVVKSNSRLGFWSLLKADVVVAVSEALRDAAVEAGLSPDRLRWTPNGVDTARFRPANTDERRELRRRLSLPQDKTIILFVGFFSRDKGPHRLFAAWSGLAETVRDRSTVLFIGQTRPPHPEIDPDLVEEIRSQKPDVRPLFVERTLEIEHYYRAADLFVLPSRREGCPNALLEAMASGLPVIATRLPGSTDSMVTDGAEGRLVSPDDVDGLRTALGSLLSSAVTAAACGVTARATACHRFALTSMGEAYFAIYETLSAP